MAEERITANHSAAFTPDVQKAITAGTACWAVMLDGRFEVLTHAKTHLPFRDPKGKPITRPRRTGTWMDTDLDGPLLAHITEFEGFVPHMYLDSVGKVTVGIGHLIADKEVLLTGELKFHYRKSTRPATDRKRLVEEYERVHNEGKTGEDGKRSNNFRASYFKRDTVFEMERADAFELAQNDINGKRKEMRAWKGKNGLPNFASYPKSAKLAILDLAFNKGVKGLFTSSEDFIKAVRKRDWRGAIGELDLERPDPSRKAVIRDWLRAALAEEKCYVELDF